MAHPSSNTGRFDGIARAKILTRMVTDDRRRKGRQGLQMGHFRTCAPQQAQRSVCTMPFVMGGVTSRRILLIVDISQKLRRRRFDDQRSIELRGACATSRCWREIHHEGTRSR
jgi:hypothetical protein